MLAAIGVVYGDIGTSPLYTMREAFGQAGGLPLGPETVLGVLSLVFWALVIVVTLKYVILIMRADNQGEGGVLALVAQGRRMKVCIPICREINLEDGSAAPLRVLPVTEHILDRAPIVIPNGAIKGRTCS